MLKPVVTFLVMVATAWAVFGALGILTWQMAVAVLVGSGLGAALSKVRPSARTPTAGGRPSRHGSTE